MSDASIDTPIVISVCFIQHDAKSVIYVMSLQEARGNGTPPPPPYQSNKTSKKRAAPPPSEGEGEGEGERRRGDETKCTKKPFGILPRTIALLLPPSASVGASDA